MTTENNNRFIIFKTEDERISVDVRFEDETVWLYCTRHGFVHSGPTPYGVQHG
jgi:hypothetical protein